jgi:hypothetical protein
MTFTAMDILSLTDPTARNTFQTNFKQGMADSARVTTDMVVINSITAGSVRVASTVYFPPYATGTPTAFTSVLKYPAVVFSPVFLELVGGEVNVSDLRIGVEPNFPVTYPPPPLVASASLTPPSDPTDLDVRPAVALWALLAAILAALLAA